MSKITTRFSRRNWLGAVSAASVAGAAGIGASAMAAKKDRRFLFVVGAAGGASIIDSFLPILDSESTTGANTYTEAQLAQPPGSNLRCPIALDNSIQGRLSLGDGYALSTFLGKHAENTVVMTQEGTSVNHLVGTRRSVTGDNISGGRTLTEAAASLYGEELLLANCNMAGFYGANGKDKSIPLSARPEDVSDPRYFAFATHGHRGIPGLPPEQLLRRARGLRTEVEAAAPPSYRPYANEIVKRYLSYRDGLMPKLEASNLMDRLMLLQSAPGGGQLSDYGLVASPELQALAERFPHLQNDPFEAQTALAYLVATSGLSCAVTIAPPSAPFIPGEDGAADMPPPAPQPPGGGGLLAALGTLVSLLPQSSDAEPDSRALTSPIGFDWSHVDHRGAQNAMWGRVMHMVDNLIELLKGQEYADGQSYWDRSVIYVATEFGRDKVSQGGSGHHLNNGNLIISPFLKGNRVYGGVDSDTALTYGFNTQTGAPEPGSRMKEGDVYSAVCTALNIDFPGRKDMSALVKG